MNKKAQGLLIAGMFLIGGLFSSQLLARDDPPSMGKQGSACAGDCKNEAAASTMMNELLGKRTDPLDAMIQTLDKYPCAVESAVAAALKAATEEQYGEIIQTALSLAGPGCRIAVMSGAVLAGVDPTPFMGIPGKGEKGLPGIINRHHGTASPS
jgi:hypothetical protein